MHVDNQNPLSLSLSLSLCMCVCECGRASTVRMQLSILVYMQIRNYTAQIQNTVFTREDDNPILTSFLMACNTRDLS